MRQHNSPRLQRRGRLVGAFGPGTCSLCLSKTPASISPPVSTGSGRDARVPSKRRSAGPVPEGRLGLTFWGRFERLGLMPYFLKVIELSPSSHGAATTEQGDTQNVILGMLNAAGFELLERGTVNVVNEWPDTSTAVRALAAAGPSVPAIEAVGHGAFCEVLREVISPLCDPDVGVRVTSEFYWITRRRLLDPR